MRRIENQTFLLLLVAVTLAFAWVLYPFYGAVLWAIVGGVLYTLGRKRMKDVDPVPRQTVETLKEDAQWVRDQRS